MPESSPAVSIIIPCHNQAAYLPSALDSVLAQTLSDWECIVINDGSSDDTDDVAKRYARKDPRIRYFYQENAGASATRNRGLRESSGRYIQFLDADDFIAPDKLKKQIQLLSGHQELSVCICDYSYTREDGSIWSEHPCYKSPQLDTRLPLYDLAVRWEDRLSIPIHCFLFDARFFKGLKISFDQNLTTNEDWDCWMSIFELRPKVIYLNEVLAFYRLHSKTKSNNKYRMRKSFLQAIQKQKMRYRGDVKMQCILSRKAKLVKRMYKDFFPPWSILLKVKSITRKTARVFFIHIGFN